MGSPRCMCEFEEVVGGADHRPLASDLVETTQRELSEASSVLDLTKDGLDDLFAQAIAAAPASPFELGGHGGNTRAGAPPFAAAAWVIVPGPAGGDEAIDPATGQMSQIGFRAETCVGGHFFGIGAKHGACRAQQWLEAACIGRAGLQALGDDDLMCSIDRDLSVVARNHTGLDRLDAAVRIGEVALRAIRRSSVGPAWRRGRPARHTRGWPGSIVGYDGQDDPA